MALAPPPPRVVRPVLPAPTAGPASGAPAAVERGRDLRIDLLRGLFVVGMIVDHVGGDSWLYLLTGGNRFYASAAEGFVFVSGLVAGRVYTRTIARDGLRVGLWRLLRRAGQLYVLAVSLSLLFVPLSELLHLPWALGWDLHDAAGFVLSTLTLHRTYYLVDVTVLYVLVLLASVIAFVILEHGHVLLILGLSWALWLAYQVAPDAVSLPWPIEGNNLFHLAAWQVLFFTGLVIGHTWDRLANLLGALPRRRLLAWAAAALAVAIALYALQDWIVGRVVRDATDPAAAQAALLASIVGKSDLRAGRLLAFGLVFVVLFLGAAEFWPRVRRWLGWLLLPLGQNALFAYALHIFVAVGVALLLRSPRLAGVPPTASHTLLQILAVLLVWLLVIGHRRLPRLRAQPVWLASPAVLALGALVVLPRLAPEAAPAAPAVAGATRAGGPSAAAVEQARAYGTAIPIGATPVPVSAAAVAAAPIAQPTPAAQPAPAAAESSAKAGVLKGTVLEPEFFSAALNTTERYTIYLPPGYASGGRRYGVLYMLHGISGSRDEWANDGLLAAADQQFADGKLPPFIIVLPQGDRGFWVNHPNNGPRWGDYLVQDLVRHVDATYATRPDVQHRALGGLSMGGWGALAQAFLHPDVFGAVGAHAPSLKAQDDPDVSFLGGAAAFKAVDPLQLASAAGSLDKLKVYLDASEHDPWLQRDLQLKQRLEARKVKVEWHQFPGQHGGSYWHDHLGDDLRFYAQAIAAQ